MWNPAGNQMQQFSPTRPQAAHALLHEMQLPLSGAFAGGLARSDLDPFSQPLRHDREAIPPQPWNRALSEPWILGLDQQHAYLHPATPLASCQIGDPMNLPSNDASTAHQDIRGSFPSGSQHAVSWHHQQQLQHARTTEQPAEIPAFAASLPIEAPVSIEEANVASGPRAKPRVRKRISKKKAGAKATVLKPMSAYNYYFRDERYNILKWKGEGLPPPASDWSEERQRALLHEHWFLDPVKGRRPHRKTEGKLGFTGYV
jgi:Ni/Co efflux regulator RcnB